MYDLFSGSEGATVACHNELSNLSQDLLQHSFANAPFEKSISVYPQKLWITLLIASSNSRLTRCGEKDFVTLLIFCN
jgi:hypothetical protein